MTSTRIIVAKAAAMMVVVMAMAIVVDAAVRVDSRHVVMAVLVRLRLGLMPFSPLLELALQLVGEEQVHDVLGGGLLEHNKTWLRRILVPAPNPPQHIHRIPGTGCPCCTLRC